MPLKFYINRAHWLTRASFFLYNIHVKFLLYSGTVLTLEMQRNKQFKLQLKLCLLLRQSFPLHRGSIRNTNALQRQSARENCSISAHFNLLQMNLNQIMKQSRVLFVMYTITSEVKLFEMIKKVEVLLVRGIGGAVQTQRYPKPEAPQMVSQHYSFQRPQAR